MPAVVLLLWGCCADSAQAENWPRFRGENGTGVSAQKGFPTTWSPGDYAWIVELPGLGHSSPSIWGEKLFITSAVDEGALRYLFCLNAVTGKQIWSRVIGMSRSHKHPRNSWASSTPTVDGERVYVTFADRENYNLAVYDFAGELLWRRSLGPFESQHGLGVSPIIFKEMVIVANDQDGPSWVVAFDRRSGKTVWTSRRSIDRASYATPFLLRPDSERPQLIVLSSAMGITSLDPFTGKLNWKSGQFDFRTVASPVFAGGLVIGSCGGGGVGKLMVGVDPSGKGDVSKTHIQYRRDRVLPYVPTPIVYNGCLFLWNDNGVVNCVDTETKANLWTERVGGNFSGSPVCIDAKLYCISDEGDVVVVAASPDYKLFGKTSLEDLSRATPAVAHGRLYLRTYHRLACLEAKGPEK